MSKTIKNPIPKLIIVDDHDIFRDGVKSILTIDAIANVIAEASNGKEFIELLETNRPNVVLMDIDMPVMGGVEATALATKMYPEINILALTMYGDENYYYQMIEAGVKGFILKSSNKSELKEAIIKVANGGTYFSNELLHKVILKIGQHKPSNNPGEAFVTFTDREEETIKLICKGLSTIEISDKMLLSPKTIENYRTKILQKTGSKNSIQLVLYALKNGIADINS